MGETKQRTCFCCGKAYHYCPHCDVDRDKPSWYFIFDSDNCRKVFDACQRYSTGECNAEQTRQKLDKCDLTNKSDFLPDVLGVIEKVFAETNKTANPLPLLLLLTLVVRRNGDRFADLLVKRNDH